MVVAADLACFAPWGSLWGASKGVSGRTSMDGEDDDDGDGDARCCHLRWAAGKWAPARQGPTGRKMESPLTLHYLRTDVTLCCNFWSRCCFLPCYVSLPTTVGSGIPYVHTCLVLYILVLAGDMTSWVICPFQETFLRPVTLLVRFPKRKTFLFLCAHAMQQRLWIEKKSGKYDTMPVRIQTN